MAACAAAGCPVSSGRNPNAGPPDDGLPGWFSDKVTCARLGNAVGPSLSGTIGQGLHQTAAQAELFSVTVEIGTYDVRRVLLAIIADNWAHARGGAGHSIHEKIKKEVRESFYPDQDHWREAITAGSRRILDLAIGGAGKPLMPGRPGLCP